MRSAIVLHAPLSSAILSGRVTAPTGPILASVSSKEPIPRCRRLCPPMQVLQLNADTFKTFHHSPSKSIIILSIRSSYF